MFDDLPETIPQKNKKKGRAIALAAGIHVSKATVTAEGTVDKVKVVSRPPMLTGAAVEALTPLEVRAHLFEWPSRSCHPDGQNQLLA